MSRNKILGQTSSVIISENAMSVAHQKMPQQLLQLLPRSHCRLRTLQPPRLPMQSLLMPQLTLQLPRLRSHRLQRHILP